MANYWGQRQHRNYNKRVLWASSLSPVPSQICDTLQEGCMNPCSIQATYIYYIHASILINFRSSRPCPIICVPWTQLRQVLSMRWILLTLETWSMICLCILSQSSFRADGYLFETCFIFTICSYIGLFTVRRHEVQYMDCKGGRVWPVPQDISFVDCAERQAWCLVSFLFGHRFAKFLFI